MEISSRYLPPYLHSLTPIQTQLLKDDEHRFFIVPPGRRSRKTLIAKRKALIWALEHNGSNIFLGAPTHAQAKLIFWNDLKRDTHYFRDSISETELKIRLKNGSILQVIGLDKPERIEGSPWHGCVISEIGNCKSETWGAHIRPALSDTHGWAILEGVPEGINFLYDLALYATGGSIPKSRPQIGSFAENPNDPEWCYYHWFSADVLTAAEIAAVKMQLDERTFRQEYEGSFESYEGLAYWAFSKENFSDIEYNPDEYVHIGMDFNVEPMTATLNHVRSDDVFQFGEIYLNHSNTYEMVEAIKSRFPVEKCIVYPDSTGEHESSNATRSDIEILRRAGFTIRANRSNPTQRDRINAVNSKMRAGDGKAHYFVNVKNCPKTVNDWNKVETLPDGRLNKIQERSGLVHISDAEGYLISFLFPIQKTIARSYDV